MAIIETAVILAATGIIYARVTLAESRIMALSDAQQTDLLAAVAQVSTDVTEAADRVAALIADHNIADPEVDAAIADLRSIGERADAIAAEAPPTE